MPAVTAAKATSHCGFVAGFSSSNGEATHPHREITIDITPLRVVLQDFIAIPP
ncbi:MAG TPA: hypothetical protein VI932_12205 [Bacteroidota bacterium]|nr:hypothetical protein [Bacteroidota bacterium]